MLNSNPTAFADLNSVLGELVIATQAILGANFCGAYLQGSFAVGDADIYSDVDFVIVTHAEISDDQVEALRSLHARFPHRTSTGPGIWKDPIFPGPPFAGRMRPARRTGTSTTAVQTWSGLTMTTPL
jgi:Nucleotidyltransferase domain